MGCYLGCNRKEKLGAERTADAHQQGRPSLSPYLRTLLVQGAQHILGPFGVDSDLRRWGLRLAERGGRNGKKRAIIAPARKLACLVASLVGEWRSVRTVAQQRPESDAGSSKRQNVLREETQSPNAEFP